MTIKEQSFVTWAILELQGQRRLGGRVSELELAGAPFLRVDVPGPDGDVATRLYPASAVQCISFTSEERARALALAERPQPVPIERVKQAVAEYYQVPLGDLNGTSRGRGVTRPRQVAMYLARELCAQSLPTIGRAFGARHHTTALRAVSRVAREVERDSRLLQQVSSIRAWLEAEQPLC
jgi:hypothetical protein